MLGVVVEGTGGRLSPHSCCDLCSHLVRSDWESRFYDEEKQNGRAFHKFLMKDNKRHYEKRQA